MRVESRRATSCFASRGQSSTPSAVIRCTAFSSPPMMPVAGRHVVGDDPVGVLARALGAARWPSGRRSRRRSRRPGAAAAGPAARWWRGCPGLGTSSSAGGAAPGSFLILPGRAPATLPVGDGGGEDRDVGRQRRLAGVQHLLRRFRPDAPRTPAGSGDGDRPADQGDAGAQRGQRRGDGMALPARRSGWRCSAPDRSARASGPLVTSAWRPASGRGRRRAAPRSAARIAGGSDMPAGAEFVAGHRALVRADDVDAARGQQRRCCAAVAACCHMRTFIAGATSTGLSVASSTRRGEIAGQARGHLRQDVGRGRRHHHQVGAARELDVAHLALVGQREQVGVDALPSLSACSDSGVTNWAPASVSTQVTAHALAAQQTDQFQRLEGGDAARDDQQDAFHADHR